MPTISLFKNSFADKPVADIEFEEFIKRIKNGFWKKNSESVRSKKEIRSYKRAKELTPGVTISAQYNSRDKSIPIDKRIKKPSSLIALDVDKKDNPQLNIKYLLDNECLAQYVSIGGEGIKIVYRCKPTTDPSEHRRIYDAAVFRLRQKGLKLKVDPIVKSIASLQYVSYDPNAFYKPNTKLVIHPLPKPKVKKREPSVDQKKDLEQLYEYIERLGDKDVTKDYEDWMNIAFGLSYSFGEAGREAFHKISANYPAYDKEECDEKFDAVLERDMESIERPITVGTVFQLIIDKLPKVTLRQLAKKHNKGHAIGKGEDVEQGDLAGLVSYKLFLFKKVFEKEENKLVELLPTKINLNEFEKLLKSKGFYRHLDYFVQIVDNIVERVDESDILRIITRYIEETGDYVFTYQKLEFKFSWEELAHLWREIRAQGTTYNQIAVCLEHWKPNLLKDNADVSYIPYLNGVVMVTGKDRKIIPYSQLKFEIWKERILPREFKYTQDVGMFEQFFGNVCGRGKNRVEQTKSEHYKRAVWYYGYMLHGVKRRSMARAWLLYDIIAGNNGRTGKSIIGQSIGKIRNMITIDGKTADFKNNRFALQKADPWTQVIFIDDPNKMFSLIPLFNMITGESDVERKGEQIITLEIKYVIASNKILEAEGASEIGRQFVTQLGDFYVAYSKKHKDTLQPIVHLHGKEFFTDWDAKDWNQFDSFCVRCLQTHLGQESPTNTIIGNSGMIRFIQTYDRELFYELSIALCSNIRKGKDGLLIGQRLLINIIKESDSRHGSIQAGRIAREFLTCIGGGEIELTSFMQGNIPQMAYKINKSFKELSFGDLSSKLPNPKL